jgi:hypothetical protein
VVIGRSAPINGAFETMKQQRNALLTATGRLFAFLLLNLLLLPIVWLLVDAMIGGAR